MATQTTNYGLTKPATSDKYDVTVFNGNADIVDTQMKANADAVATKEPKITGAATSITGSNLTASRALVSNSSGKVAVSDVTATELSYLDGVTGNIQTQIDGKLDSDGTAIKATADGSGNNIATTYETKANAITGLSVSGKVITYTKGDGTTGTISTQDTDNDTKNTAGSTDSSSKLFLIGATSQAANPQTYSHDTAYVGTDGKLYSGGKVVIASGDKATSASTADTATKATQDASGNTITSTYATKTEMNSAVGAKQDTVTGAATSIVSDNLTASRALVSDSSGKVAVSPVTSTELGYLDGVTSAIQTQIDGKQDTLTAGTGLAIASDGVTVNHSNSVTAQTTYVGSATAVPRLKFDAQGHITGVSTATIYPPTSAGSAGQVWVSDGTGAGAWKTLVTLSTSEPSGGSDGDLWFVYE